MYVVFPVETQFFTACIFHLFMNVCMLCMYIALLNDNSLKYIYTLSIICVSFTDPVFLRVFRSVCNSLYHIIYSYTHCILGDPDTLQLYTG